MSEQRTSRLSRRQVFMSDHTPLGVSRHTLDGSLAAHSHDFVEVAIVAGGYGWHRTIYGRQPVDRGDAFILRPGSWHAYEECDGLWIHNCCFGGELLQRELTWILDDPLLGYLFGTGPFALDRRGVAPIRLDESALIECLERLTVLEAAERDERPGARVDLIANLLMLLGRLARSADFDGDHRAHTPTRNHPAVLQAARLLDSELRRPWTLGMIAAEVAMDGSYLVRLFKESAGLPPMKYLARARAEKAADLLLRTDSTVSQIGREVGWPDPSSFASRFRSHFGLTPSAYRASFDSREAADSDASHGPPS